MNDDADYKDIGHVLSGWYLFRIRHGTVLLEAWGGAPQGDYGWPVNAKSCGFRQ
jgi:hypothetical protein